MQAHDDGGKSYFKTECYLNMCRLNGSQRANLTVSSAGVNDIICSQWFSG